MTTVLTGFEPFGGDAVKASGSAKLPLADIAQGLEIAVRTSLEVTADAAIPGGTLH